MVSLRAPHRLQWLALYLTIHLSFVASEFFKPFNVSYDHRALIIDGKRRMLISGGIHYPRATPEMWPDLISKSKEGGVDVIQTYAFWNGHEPERGQYNFEGRYDIVKFVKLVGSSGLYLHLRIGPYVCAEWNFGGFPVWLRDIPGIEFRTNNAPFKEEMQRFVKKIVDIMREEMLFSWQGGPIIMLQIENEYGNIEGLYGQSGKEYVKWAAKMALSLGAGVPWVMCKQVDAPDDIIDACNGYYCDGYRPNSYHKPQLWTEDWDGWYTKWGGRLPHRPVEDLAFAVARFFQRGGSFQNYYMYFGGTNFGRTSGGPFYITSYDYDAPIDEFGLLSEPKWGHLKDLHAAIKLCEPGLVAADSPHYVKLGPKQEAHIYHGSVHEGGLNFSLYKSQGKCAAFIANIDEHKAATVAFLGQKYTLPPWSVSVLPDCRNTIFNTAKVAAQTSIKTAELHLPISSDNSEYQELKSDTKSFYISKSWMTTEEPISIWSKNNFTVQGMLEHLNVTKDYSDYLWYATRIYVSDDDVSFWDENNINPAVTIDSMRDVLHVFVNGQHAASLVTGSKSFSPFNFTEVAAQTSIKTAELHLPISSDNSEYQELKSDTKSFYISKSWMTTEEPISIWSKNNFTVQGMLEHLNVTKDYSDYLWYATRIYVSDDDVSFWDENNINPAVTIDSMRDVLHVFVNGQHAGSVVGHWVKVFQSVQFHRGYNDLVFLTETVGLQNYGAFLERDGAGLRGKIELTGFKDGDIDLSKSTWTYQVGLKGEVFKIYSIEEREKEGWSTLTLDAIPSMFTWYKTYFDAPATSDPVALDLGSMGKGQVWVNGHHIGRYWTLTAPKDGCQRSCDYRGAYNSDKCSTNCGKPTQTLYHIPRSWLQTLNNLLVIFEETGGNPFEISIKLHKASIICAQVSESHYPPLHKWFKQDPFDGKISVDGFTPEMQLHCQDGYMISFIKFASYGTPYGSCKAFSTGNCHAPDSLAVVSKACLGRNSCSIGISNLVFGGDPCQGIVKTLAVQARCMSSNNDGFFLS